jgi:glutaredoxin 3
MKVEIYSKDQCGYCDMAIKLAEMRQLDTVVKKLGVDFDREQLLEKFPGARTFPIVLVDGEVVGGYTDFVQYLKGN